LVRANNHRRLERHRRRRRGERRLRHLIRFRERVNASVQTIHPGLVGLGRQIVGHLEIQIVIGGSCGAESSEKSYPQFLQRSPVSKPR
jgi:hypothetical protein